MSRIVQAKQFRLTARKSRALTIAASAALLVASSCGPKKQEAEPGRPPAPPVNAWKITTLDPNGAEPAYLGNGILGVRLSRSGSSIDADGRLLPSFTPWNYSPGVEEKILPSPGLSDIRWSVNGHALAAQKCDAGSYSQVLNMKTGTLTTSWRQRCGNVEVSIRGIAVVDPVRPELAMKWQIKLSSNATVEADVQEPGSPLSESMFQRYGGWLATHLTKRTVNHGVIFSRTVQSSTLVDFDLSSLILDPRTVEDKLRAGATTPTTFNDALSASAAYLKREWKSDIVIDGPIADQQAIHSFLFYLRSSVTPYGAATVGPFGLSSQKYNGHVFWDADVWVLPSLALLDPNRARAIAQYRLHHADAARMNFDVWAASQKIKSPGTGIRFPWESSVTGKETDSTPSVHEIHITGSVMLGLRVASRLGLISQQKYNALKREAGRFYYLRSAPSTNGRELLNVMSPDESHTGNNDLYTNLLAQWLDPRHHYELPHDAHGFLTYDGDRLREYKQAAAILGIYPLQNQQCEDHAREMMARFAGKNIPNGPAMSQSLESLIWARLGRADRAYPIWQQSWQDYTKHPLLLFSEKKIHSDTYFVTGAAGCLQAVLYGFAGFRLDSKAQPGAIWATPVRGGELSILPHLPSAWKSVTVRGLRVLGKIFTLSIHGDRCTVSQGE